MKNKEQELRTAPELCVILKRENKQLKEKLSVYSKYVQINFEKNQLHPYFIALMIAKCDKTSKKANMTH